MRRGHVTEIHDIFRRRSQVGQWLAQVLGAGLEQRAVHLLGDVAEGDDEGGAPVAGARQQAHPAVEQSLVVDGGAHEFGVAGRFAVAAVLLAEAQQLQGAFERRAGPEVVQRPAQPQRLAVGQQFHRRRIVEQDARLAVADQHALGQFP